MRKLLSNRAGTLLAGLICGVVLALAMRWAPESQLHAVASHSQDTCAVATGFLQEDVEAFFFLDYITGDLRGTALNTQTGKFAALFHRNVLADLGMSGAANAKFTLVTGQARLSNRGSAIRPGLSVVYVTDQTSGATAAYGVPTVPNLRQRGQGPTEFVLLDTAQFRNVQLR